MVQENITSQRGGPPQSPKINITEGVSSLRALRASLASTIYSMVENAVLNEVLLLVDPLLTSLRIKDEVQMMRRVLREDLAARLNVAIYRGGKLEQVDAKANEHLIQDQLDSLVSRPYTTGGHAVSSKQLREKLPKQQTGFCLTQILVHQWMMNQEPSTMTWLSQAGGWSQPTVLRYVREMGESLVRSSAGSSRGVSVRPEVQSTLMWMQMLVQAKRARCTVEYVDRSGNPRSFQSLLQRLYALKRDDLAVGGALGAGWFYPDIDLTGTPRLDVSMHVTGNEVDYSFIEQLDPGLKRLEPATGEGFRGDNPPPTPPSPPLPPLPPRVVVHLVRRAESFFRANEVKESTDLAAHSKDVRWWADPLECYLDLLEMRFNAQADALLQHVKGKRD